MKRAGIPKTLRVYEAGHRSKSHAVYESDSSSGEDAPGVPRVKPKGGWRVEDKLGFVPLHQGIRFVTRRDITTVSMDAHVACGH